MVASAKIPTRCSPRGLPIVYVGRNRPARNLQVGTGTGSSVVRAASGRYLPGMQATGKGVLVASLVH